MVSLKSLKLSSLFSFFPYCSSDWMNSTALSLISVILPLHPVGWWTPFLNFSVIIFFLSFLSLWEFSLHSCIVLREHQWASLRLLVWTLFQKNNYLFIYLFLAALGLLYCLRALSCCRELGLLSSGGYQTSHGSGFSCWVTQALEWAQ